MLDFVVLRAAVRPLVSLAVLSCFNNFIAMIIVLLWANNINIMCEPVNRVLVLKFPVFCLKKNGKLGMYFHALNLCL